MGSSDTQRIYELVCRHFLATISPDATFLCTKAKFSAATSGESFTLRGKKELLPGFLQIYRTCISYNSGSSGGSSGGGEDAEDEDGEGGSGGLLELPELEKGRAYRIASLKQRQGATTPPGKVLTFLFKVQANTQLLVYNVLLANVVIITYLYSIQNYS